MKSNGPNEPKKNKAPFTPYKKVDDDEQKIEEAQDMTLSGADVVAEELEKVGFAEKTK